MKTLKVSNNETMEMSIEHPLNTGIYSIQLGHYSDIIEMSKEELIVLQEMIADILEN